MPKGSATVGPRRAWSLAIAVGLPGRIAGAQSADEDEGAHEAQAGRGRRPEGPAHRRRRAPRVTASSRAGR